MNWISVNEILPGKGERVLVYDLNFGVQIGWVTNVEKWQLAYAMPTKSNVEAWMPLPEPPCPNTIHTTGIL